MGEATKSLRVLIVDDNEHNREYARQVLTGLFRVDLAGDGVEALERVRGEAPDLVVLDLSMPRLDGWGVIRALREDGAATREIPVMACSAHAMRGDRERALAAGFDAYLTKPFRAEELLGAVEQFLGKPDEASVEDDGWGGADWSLDGEDWSDEEDGT